MGKKKKKKDAAHRDKLTSATYVWANRHAKADNLFRAAADLIWSHPVPRQEADELVEAIHTAVGRAMAAEVVTEP